MNSRLIKVLLGLTGALALLVFSHYFLQSSRPTYPFSKALDIAHKITLQVGSDTVELQKEGLTWNVGSGGSRYRADSQGKVASAIRQLKALKVEDEIAERPDRASDYQVDPASGARVSLYDSKGTLLSEGILGKQAPIVSHIYFKYTNKPSVFLARGLTRSEVIDMQVDAWRDKTLLDIPEDHVEAVFMEGPHFKTPLVRSSDTWSANGKLLNPTPIWGLIGVLAHLKAEGFVDVVQHPELSAENLKYASITLQIRGGDVHILHLGASDASSKQVPIAVDKETSVGWITEDTARLLLRKLSDFPTK